MSLTESIVEDASRESFGALGHAVWNRPRLAPGEPAAEWNRSAAEMDGVNSFGEVVLVGRLREAIRRLNPANPEEARATHKESLSVQNERRPNP
jgi:type I restriction enzyme R subunit